MSEAIRSDVDTGRGPYRSSHAWLYSHSDCARTVFPSSKDQIFQTIAHGQKVATAMAEAQDEDERQNAGYALSLAGTLLLTTALNIPGLASPPE